MDFSDSLDHDGNILVQVAAIEFHQINKNMEKVRCKAYIHPQEDKACWERKANNIERKKKMHVKSINAGQYTVANKTIHSSMNTTVKNTTKK